LYLHAKLFMIACNLTLMRQPEGVGVVTVFSCRASVG
jgi:hypothetical protein